MVVRTIAEGGQSIVCPLRRPIALCYSPAMPLVLQSPRRRWWLVAILAALLVILALTNKGMFLAAVVDGKPIFAWQLNRLLRDRFGKQTLEGVIAETLVSAEAKKQGVSISSADIEAKQKEILGSLGDNVNLDDLLRFQGLTKADFDNQIRLQLTVEKLLSRDLTITEDDINNFIATNRATLIATEEAALREEARRAIISQKVSNKLQEWFAELKEKAKILRFL